MITRNALRAIALATTCLAPLAAFADDAAPTPPGTDAAASASSTPAHGDIQINVGGVAGNNADQAGRYNGLNTTGFFGGIGKLDIGGGSAWDSGGTRYYELNGNNLIFQGGNNFGTDSHNASQFSSQVDNKLVNSGSLDFKIGDQGIWGVGAYYDSITYTGNVIDSIYNVNGGIATLNNGLAPWGGATATRAGVTSFTIPALTATGAMQPFQTGVRRDIFGGDFKYIWGDWTFTGVIRHEHKEGSMEESFDGPWGGTAFALPINYDTDRYDAIAAYNAPHFQGLAQYTYSRFNDNTSFVNLPYPTSNTTTPYQRSAAYSTPPSNDAHYLTFMGSTDVVPLTRITVNGRFGLELQNDTFAPNTADPNPGPTVGLSPTLMGTTSSSPNMTAEVYQLKISAASHPIPNVDTRVFYGLDARSVSVDQNKVDTGGEGGGTADAGLTTGTYNYVVPQDWFKQNAGAEVGYRILPASDTKVTVGYRYDGIDRSNAQVGRSSTSTATVAVLSELGSQVNGKISFDYSDRTGTISYLTPWANLAGSPSGQTYSGAYYQAPMTSEAVTFRADYTPMHVLTSGVFLQFKNENYTYGDVSPVGTATAATIPLTGEGGGVKQDYTLTVGPDINYRPTETINVHLFYTFEMLYYNNLGNGACSTPSTATTAACKGTAGYFQNTYSSSTNTIGLSGEWQINEKLKLRGDYTLSYGTVMFGEYNGVFVGTPTASYQNVGNYPDINSLMNSIKVTATYQLRPDIQLIAEGFYTSFHNNDWDDTANAIQGAGTSAISILTPGYASPNYSIVALVAGIKFRF